MNLTTGALLRAAIASRRAVAKFAAPPHTLLFAAKMRQHKILRLEAAMKTLDERGDRLGAYIKTAWR